MLALNNKINSPQKNSFCSTVITPVMSTCVSHDLSKLVTFAVPVTEGEKKSVLRLELPFFSWFLRFFFS